MRLKLLLLVFLLSGGLLSAQDTINTLIITEAYLDDGPAIGYFELTNVGDQPIQLNQFKFAEMRPWGDAPWQNPADRWWILPDHVLNPGESFVMAAQREFGPRQFRKGLDGPYPERGNKPEMLEIADILYQIAETNGDETDLVDPMPTNFWTDLWNGRSCAFIQQYLSDVDSVVVDQVNGWFDGDNGLNIDKGGYDIGGITQASAHAYLIRKASVKHGNLDFANAAGIGEDDGEWIVVPREGGVWRDVMWTVGNHGSFVLDENTLESDIADIDFANKTITVPWGTRKHDGIMRLMKRKPGLAWNYTLNANHEDSLSFAAKTGDVLNLTVAGDTWQKADFTIIVAEPTADANIVVPRVNEDPAGNWRTGSFRNRPTVYEGIQGWPRVTMHENGQDSIWGSRWGIPYATRVDSLLERLEKPANATWEIVWVDGVERPDLKDGDILRVTSQSGKVKDYYIAVLPFRAAHNAQLASITWPDIPEYYKGIFGWVGDTIPNFGPTVYNYILTVPVDVDGIPALVAKPQDANARVSVKRAANLVGTKEDRTISFTVTAQDDTTIRVYNVELVKEQNPLDVQPWSADPIISEVIFWEQWSNGFVEIFNPGNQPLDLSNYMFFGGYSNNPAEAITWYGQPGDWMNRYGKYVPGYKWVNEAQWQVTPAILEQDLAVNPIVMPGDVFVMGGIYTSGFTHPSWAPDYVWPVPAQLDVQFNNDFNDWGIQGNPWNEPVGAVCCRQWNGANYYLYKILNDSVKMGLKPATDPNDFLLIETFGEGDGSAWSPGGIDHGMITSWVRKPEYWKGKTGFRESFGDTPEESEWTWTNQAYWNNLNAGWPFSILYVGNDLGKHFMYTVTHFMSTVSSVVYKVSPGYGKDGALESIRGMTPGVTAGEFLGNIVKKNEGQVLKVKGAAGELAMDALLNNNDTLVVMSADSTNVTKYLLEVAEGGLSSDAILTSSRYNITIVSEPKSGAENENAGVGTITGFDYGTSLKTILANITVPAGASMDVVDANGAYVPLVRLNFDTTYVNVTVNSNTYFDVIAENGVTEIVYQLIPDVSDDDAFITSDIYSVSQKDLLVQFVPRGTDVRSFLANIVPSAGSTVKIVNKMGQDRVDGVVADDDKVVVTSPNGKNTTVYYIAMLSEQYVREITYLAYITSKVYGIDQVKLEVAKVNKGTTVANFYANIVPSMGATAMVTDKNGVEKTSGEITSTDKVVVTSLDGKHKNVYTFATVVSAETMESVNIDVYPNPTTDLLNIRGVQPGNRVRVYNAVGAMIRDISVQRNIETVRLDKEPAGMYMIVVSSENEMLGRFKAVKK